MENVDQVENGYGCMTNIWHFWVKYLFILETEVCQFRIESSRISTYDQELCNKVHIVLCTCDANALVWIVTNFSQVEDSVLNNFNKYVEKFPFFKTKPFVSYFVLNMGQS
jgi:hypothetical protein